MRRIFKEYMIHWYIFLIIKIMIHFYTFHSNHLKG